MPTIVSVIGVEPFRIGGTETYARELSNQLAGLGWNSVLCFQSEPSQEVRRFLDLPNITFEVLPDSTNVSWKSATGLATILRRHQPEVLHLHYTSFLAVYPWVAALCSVRKVFFTDHTSRPAGYVPHRAPLWKRALVRLINIPLTRVICVSEYGYRCMTALDLLPTNRYEMIYNSVDLSRVSPSDELAADFRRRHGIPEGRTVVLQVSWIIPEKGITDLLEAARLVIEQDKNVQFVFVGEGAYRDQYTSDAMTMGIADHITWTGLVLDPFGDGVYDAADIVCQVSRWEEVFGWVIAEAMAYGKPVVGTRVGGIPELVVDQQSGFVVGRSDVPAIADRILTLVRNPQLREQMGQVGSKAVSARFELRANISKLIDSYGINAQRKPRT